MGKHERIETTVVKAKELKRYVEPLVEKAKRGLRHDVTAIRGWVTERPAIDKLLNDLAERYRLRQGGYTRVMRTRFRRGDNAEMAYIEFVDRNGELRPARPPKQA